MSHGLDLGDTGTSTRPQGTRIKKPIKNPFTINFDDPVQQNEPDTSHFGGHKNPTNEYQSGTHHRNTTVQNPFAANEEDLTGVISLDDNKPKTSGGAKIFNPMTYRPEPTKSEPSQLDENDDPPLLEDLGIDLQNIKAKTLAIIRFKKIDEQILESADMSGPILYALIFGGFLLLNGKVHFGYIYGFSLVGSLLIYSIMNLLSQEKTLELYNTVSILGYGLLPIVILSAIAVIFTLNNLGGFVLSFGAVIWASVTASRMIAGALNLMEQKWLIGYPIFLFYIVFVILAVF
mmetsp:Transcript_76090/g.88470  ORF Transcript_76090/g.88470 Transcript_76090/m.88470 type:complete len:290 (+) Transcript_76090:31-900(+)